jgi:ketosteroid isomerase-like protein
LIAPDRVVIEFVTSGTPVGGERYEVAGCSVLELRDGKVSADRAYRTART